MQQVHGIGTGVTEHCTLTRSELRHVGYLRDGATPNLYYSKLQHLKHKLMFSTPSFREILFLHSHFPPFFIIFFFFLFLVYILNLFPSITLHNAALLTQKFNFTSKFKF